MNKLPIEIENEIWSLYYSNIYYTNVISVFKKQRAICNEINEVRGFSTALCLLKHYNKELLKLVPDVYDNEDVKRRLFQLSFYNFGRV